MIQGFKNFLMRGDVIVVAVGLVVALAFTTNIITPIISALQGGQSIGLGFTIRAGNAATFVNIGAFISAVIYFIVFMLAVYFVLVVPYKAIQARRGIAVFGDPAPAKTCPACLSDDLPVGASKCKYCGTEQPAIAG
jgi:large conductance mechanosensitive channel